MLVTIDTLRADYCSHNGHPRKTTPFLDQLAAGGASFGTAYAPSSWTPPTMASIMTGLHPPSHGVAYGVVTRDGAAEQHVLSDRHATLAERFHDAGFVTIAAPASRHLAKELGFAQGFDVYPDQTPFLDASDLNELVRAQMKKAFGDDWRNAWKSRKTFLWIHYFDPHDPFGTHPEYVARFAPAKPGEESLAGSTMHDLTARFPYPKPELEASLGPLYEADVAYLDDRFAELAAELGLEDDGVLVAVTADHGEAFGTHNALGHSQHLYDELVRVPLVLHWKGGIGAGLRSEVPVNILDLYATLPELAGLPPEEEVHARSLTSPVHPVFASLLYPKPRAFALREERWKLVNDPTEGGGSALYDLAKDPHERRDVAGWHPWRVRRMESELAAWRGGLAPAPDLESVGVDPKVKEELDALNYVH